jgi:hypothetical protein
LIGDHFLFVIYFAKEFNKAVFILEYFNSNLSGDLSYLIKAWIKLNYCFYDETCSLTISQERKEQDLLENDIDPLGFY